MPKAQVKILLLPEQLRPIPEEKVGVYFWPLKTNQLLRKICLRICPIIFFDVSEAAMKHMVFSLPDVCRRCMRESRTGMNHTSNSLQESIHQASERKEICFIWFFLLCYVIKALLFTRGHGRWSRARDNMYLHALWNILNNLWKKIIQFPNQNAFKKS